jgi:hypothetical protein
VPPVKLPVTVISGWESPPSCAAKVITTGVPGSGPPVAVTPPVPTVLSASSAVTTADAAALYAMAPVV